MKPVDQYFLNLAEPNASCMIALRKIILDIDPHVEERLSYQMPFYFVKGKRFCYLWSDKKNDDPYIGIVNGNRIEFEGLIQESRKKMKIFPIDPNGDLPIRKIQKLLRLAIKCTA